MVSKRSIEAKVRPLANASLEKASLLGAARLYINKDSLIALTGFLENGKTCIIEKLNAEGESAQGGPLKREAALWVLTDKNVSPNVVMMSRAFQDATGFKIGDQVRLSPAESPAAEAREVVVRDVSSNATEAEDICYSSKYDYHWAFSIGLSLKRAEQVFPGMVLEGVSIGKLRRNYKVISVNSQQHILADFDLPTAEVCILPSGGQDPAADDPQNQERGELVLKGVPGFTNSVEHINDFLASIGKSYPVKSEAAPCGLVIHGGHGNGKTFILKRIADTNWGKVHWIKPGAKLTYIKEVFQQAVAQQPCMVLIDGLQELVPEDRANREAVIDTIADALDTLSSVADLDAETRPRVVVIATCLDYYAEIPLKLQKPGRFSRNVVLPIPRASERLEILKYRDPSLRPEEKEACLLNISQRTHAFSCQDLLSLLHNAFGKYAARMRKRCQGTGLEMEQYLSVGDMEHALHHTRPSAMRDINLQPPVVHWQDVGGQDSVKKALARMIKYTKDTDMTTPRVIRNPPKGLLLYGPPGCSKTLSAQALATESSFNFFAVKGAELLNMYVGESERAVRSLFLRARAASPSIIFFDEIDSIGGQRSEGGGGARSTGSVNVLTTLLTELDGFEDLSGVLVIAATNRPDAIDPALMRPGRFDRAIYVGLPDLAARESIFRINLRGQPLAADVDIPTLAARSEGHSGAEIKHITRETEITVQERYDDDETGTVKLEISMGDLEAALSREPKRITSKMLDGYTRWMQQLDGGLMHE